MVSAINPDLPRDGVPTRKGDLRANFQRAKAEIESLQVRLDGPSASLINPRDFGATGDGVNDDLPSLEAAFSAAQAAGRNLYLPPGIYRITDTWHWGGPAFVDIQSLWIEDADIGAADKYHEFWGSGAGVNPTHNGANQSLAIQAQKVAVRGAGDGQTVIWGNFGDLPSGVKPIIMDWQAFEYESGGLHWAGARMVSGDFSIIGNNNTVKMEPPHRVVRLNPFTTVPSNRQAGIFSVFSQMGLQNITFTDLHVGLLRQDCYWSRQSNLYAKNCTYAFTFWQHNAAFVDNFHGNGNRDGTRFLRCSGVGTTFRDMSTQQYDTDIHLVWGSDISIDGAYFENVRSTAGYSIKCGTTPGQGAVYNCGFNAVKNGRTSLKSWQFAGTYDCSITNSRMQPVGAPTEVVFLDAFSFVRGFSWDWINESITPGPGKTIDRQVWSWGRPVGSSLDPLWNP